MSTSRNLSSLLFFPLILGICMGSVAKASDDSVVLQDSDKDTSWVDAPASKQGELATPADLFARTRAILEHFGIPAEPEAQPLVSYLDGRQTEQGMRIILP